MTNLFQSSWHGHPRKSADAAEKDDGQRELIARAMRASKHYRAGTQRISLAHQPRAGPTQQRRRRDLGAHLALCRRDRRTREAGEHI